MTLRPLHTRRWLLAAALLASCRGDTPATDTASTPTEAKPIAQEAPPRLAGWGGPAPAGTPDLVHAELARDLRHASIEASLAEPATHDAAAWTRGRIGGIGAAEDFFVVIDDAGLSAQALAAIGFLERSTGSSAADAFWRGMENGLWTRYAITEDAARSEALLFAVARVGAERSQRLLVVELADPAADEASHHRRAAVLDAIGMLCAAGQPLDADGLQALSTRLSDGTVPKATARTLARCTPASAENLSGELRRELVAKLLAIVGDQDPDIARSGWKALAAIGAGPQTPPPEVLADVGPAWQVEVEAVRALAAHAATRSELVRRLGALPISSVTGPRVHVVMEVLRALRPLVGPSPELIGGVETFGGAVETARAQSPSPRRAKALALLHCEVELLRGATTGSLQKVDSCAVGVEQLPAHYGRVLAADSLLAAGPVLSLEARATGLLERAVDPNTAVAAAGLTALSAIDDPRVSAVLRRALLHRDAGVKTAAASTIATRAVDRSRRDPLAVEPLADLVRTLSNDSAIEARIAAIDALGNLARSDVAAGSKPKQGTPPPVGPGWLNTVVMPLAGDPAVAIRRAGRRALSARPDLLAEFDAKAPVGAPFGPAVTAAVESGLQAAPERLRIRTEAGELVIDLRGAAAPIAQAVVAKLADDGFYDGLTFHRVVPGFVVQGGDPRGDGYGGPGFVIPCERSSQKYHRGSVGIALAGKDTGGSQIFIAQSRVPRLDGRYTLIGQVSEGMDVVDQILPFDRMIEVEVQRAK